MPRFAIYSRMPRSSGEMGEWFYNFGVTARSEKAALVKARAAHGFSEDAELKAELSKVQRTVRKFPKLADPRPQKCFIFKQKIRRTNEVGTCLWCGQRLVRRHDEGYGAYADNAFCSLSCGYEFGITAAVHNFRLQPRSDD